MDSRGSTLLNKILKSTCKLNSLFGYKFPEDSESTPPKLFVVDCKGVKKIINPAICVDGEGYTKGTIDDFLSFNPVLIDLGKSTIKSNFYYVDHTTRPMILPASSIDLYEQIFNVNVSEFTLPISQITVPRDNDFTNMVETWEVFAHKRIREDCIHGDLLPNRLSLNDLSFNETADLVFDDSDEAFPGKMKIFMNPQGNIGSCYAVAMATNISINRLYSRALTMKIKLKPGSTEDLIYGFEKDKTKNTDLIFPIPEKDIYYNYYPQRAASYVGGDVESLIGPSGSGFRSTEGFTEDELPTNVTTMDPLAPGVPYDQTNWRHVLFSAKYHLDMHMQFRNYPSRAFIQYISKRRRAQLLNDNSSVLNQGSSLEYVVNALRLFGVPPETAYDYPQIYELSQEEVQDADLDLQEEFVQKFSFSPDAYVMSLAKNVSPDMECLQLIPIFIDDRKLFPDSYIDVSMIKEFAGFSDAENKTIALVRKCISKFQPLFVNFKIFDDYVQPWIGSKIYPPTPESVARFDGNTKLFHTTNIIGYDDDYEIGDNTGAFILHSTWGNYENGADYGVHHMSYRDFFDYFGTSLWLLHSDLWRHQNGDNDIFEDFVFEDPSIFTINQTQGSFQALMNAFYAQCTKSHIIDMDCVARKMTGSWGS